MSLTKTTCSMIENSPLDLTDYGAVGDGSANDTAAWIAFTSACASLSKSGYVPSGTYLIDSFSFTDSYAGLVLYGDSYGRTGVRPSVPAGPGVFGLSPTLLRFRGASGNFISIDGAYDLTISNISLDGAGTADAVLYFTGTSNNTHVHWVESDFMGAKASTGYTHQYAGTNGGESCTFRHRTFRSRFPASASTAAAHLYMTNSNAFLGSYENCVFSNAVNLVLFEQGSASLYACEFYGASGSCIRINTLCQPIVITLPYTEQLTSGVPFINIVATAGANSSNSITIINPINNSVNSPINISCTVPVQIYGGNLGHSFIDITPAATYGTFSVIADGVQFSDGGFSGSGVSTHLYSRGCGNTAANVFTPIPSSLQKASVAYLTNTGISVLDVGTVLTATGTTPAVPTTKYFTIANASPTSINTFTGGVDGQELVIRFNNANTTLVNYPTGAFLMSGSTNYNPTGGVISFICLASGTLWQETSRAVA